MGEFSPRGRGVRKEVQEIVKGRIMGEVRARSGYDISTLRKRLQANAYDAIMVLRDVAYLAPKNFFFTHFGISPHDFKRKPK